MERASIFPTEMQLSYGGGSPLYAEMFDCRVRARATFPQPILFGGTLALTITLVVYYNTYSGTRVKSQLLKVVLLLMLWSLYKTGSRGPWLAAAFAMCILMVAASAGIRRRLITLTAFAVAVLILRPGVADTLWNMYRGTMDPTSMMGSSFEY